MDRPIINAIYFTEKDKSKPMMVLPLDSTKLHIDIHVQVINFTLDKHTLTFVRKRSERKRYARS